MENINRLKKGRIKVKRLDKERLIKGLRVAQRKGDAENREQEEEEEEQEEKNMVSRDELKSGSGFTREEEKGKKRKNG